MLTGLLRLSIIFSVPYLFAADDLPAVKDDQEAAQLAGEICRDISAQLKFPGMIRVTVVRELRCTEYAK